jgi:beta-N-acetylhexosaminidase
MSEHQARRLLGKIYSLRFPRSWDGIDLDRFPVGNYIVFRAELAASAEEARSRIASARAMLRERGIEPLLMMDEEGGRVTQIGDFFPAAPSALAVANALTPERARDIYGPPAECLASLGIDVSLFPCLDVETEPLNPIIGTRSYGDAPETATAYARAALAASRPHIACVGKHFPGHGMTREDSHRQRPVVDESAGELESVHLEPFSALARSGLDGIMVSHCTYTAIQQDARPASLSGRVVGHILRERLGYKGAVMTDSLDMDAVTSELSPETAARMALEAGCDILLYTEYSKRFEQAFESAVEAMVAGELDAARIRMSVSRRNLLRRRSASAPPDRLSVDQSYLALRQRVFDNAIEIQDPLRSLPLSRGRVAAVVSPERTADLIRTGFPEMHEAAEPGDTRGMPLILWLTEPLSMKCPVEVMRQMIEISDQAVLVTTYQALMTELSEADACILTRDSSPDAEKLIMAMLSGAGP